MWFIGRVVGDVIRILLVVGCCVLRGVVGSRRVGVGVFLVVFYFFAFG